MNATEVSIPLADALLAGDMSIPSRATGLVIFAHGSGSSRRSPRNQFVAGELRRNNLGTFLFDLLTPKEELTEARTRHLRFDISFLARRLVAATLWLAGELSGRGLRFGYFGASTGAAAALVAAAQLPETIATVVSRGGRPDLAEPVLEQVKAPTLLIVGGEDTSVIALNEQAYSRLGCEKSLKIVPGASHLFEEAGALEVVAALATDWFLRHLAESGIGRSSG